MSDEQDPEGDLDLYDEQNHYSPAWYPPTPKGNSESRSRSISPLNLHSRDQSVAPTSPRDGVRGRSARRVPPSASLARRGKSTSPSSARSRGRPLSPLPARRGRSSSTSSARSPGGSSCPARRARSASPSPARSRSRSASKERSRKGKKDKKQKKSKKSKRSKKKKKQQYEQDSLYSKHFRREAKHEF